MCERRQRGRGQRVVAAQGGEVVLGRGEKEPDEAVEEGSDLVVVQQVGGQRFARRERLRTHPPRLLQVLLQDGDEVVVAGVCEDHARAEHSA